MLLRSSGVGRWKSRREESIEVFTVASLFPVGTEGAQSDRPPRTRLDKPEVCSNSSLSKYSKLTVKLRATNHLDVCSVSPLRRLTAKVGPLCFAASTQVARSPRQPSWGAGPSRRSARQINQLLSFLVPFRFRRCRNGSSFLRRACVSVL